MWRQQIDTFVSTVRRSCSNPSLHTSASRDGKAVKTAVLGVKGRARVLFTELNMEGGIFNAAGYLV